jgi:hypothetical protein
MEKRILQQMPVKLKILLETILKTFICYNKLEHLEENEQISRHMTYQN